ncbi:MAG: hypothetical protein H6510_12025 [Acidobacteria bacterium]|nr:hypothetical protein [Acidobacteriota bacterium]
MIRQYVNLDPDPDHPHYGDEIPLTADANQINADDSVRSEWWIEAQGQNQPERFLSRAARAHFSESYPRNQDHQFHNTLHLPHVGGDAYNCFCSKRDDRDNHHSFETIETWRKLYLSIWFMNDRCEQLFDSAFAMLRSEAERGFVELEEVNRFSTRTDEEQTVYHNGLRHLYQDPNNAQASALEHTPFHMRVIVMNRLFNPATKPYPGESQEVSHTQNTQYDLPETGWLASGRIRLKKRGAQWRTVNEGDEIIERTGIRSFRCDLSSLPEYWEDSNFNGHWQYEFVTHELNDLAGGNVGNLSLICTYSGQTAVTAEQSATIQTHEFGHACGQTVRRERTYNAHGGTQGWENHPTWYNDQYGGLGNHCSHNARLEPNAQSHQEYVPIPSMTTCVMYHQLHVQQGRQYCANCLARLQRADLGRANMIARHWDRY